jgi:hypothetical protein
MNGAQPQKVNSLVLLTRAAGVAALAGNETQLREAVRALGTAGGSFASASRATLGTKPSPLPALTRKAGNSEGTPHRAIQKDRPSQGHSR